MLKGVLFDMDGVLVDSEEFIRNAVIMMYREMGIETKHEDYFEFIGTGEDRFIGGVGKKYGVEVDIKAAKARAYQIYREIIRGKLKPLSGVDSFMNECRKKGLKTAVATSADKEKMDANLAEIGLDESSFDAVVNAHDVERQKPFPDIYRKAASLLGLDPSECLVVEDAVNGVEAAKAAGARCLGITSSFSEEELSKADWHAENLAEAGREVLDW
jgi:beta-phosphoglucomutase